MLASLPANGSENMGDWVWDFLPAYRLTRSKVEDYLRDQFGNYDFNIEVSAELNLAYGRLQSLTNSRSLMTIFDSTFHGT